MILYSSYDDLPSWLAWFFSIFFLLLGIGSTLYSYLDYIEDIETGSRPGLFYNDNHQGALTYGLYCIAMAIAGNELKQHTDFLLFFCLPSISIFGGITMGAYVCARIYLMRKSLRYDINKYMTTLMLIVSIILILPIVFPFFYIVKLIVGS